MSQPSSNLQAIDPQTTEVAETEPRQVTPPTEVAPAATPDSNAKVLTIPSNAMARIKREEREKGKKGAMVELEGTAKKAGFASVEEMMKAASQFKRQQPKGGTPQRTQPASVKLEAKPAVVPILEARPVDRAMRRADREREKALEEIRRLNRSRAGEEKRRKTAERRIDVLEAEVVLRTAAARAGVQDIDYALAVLQRQVGNDTVALKAFDENEFFSKTLRASHPYLYGVSDQLANTSSNDVVQRDVPKPGAPPPPKPTGAGGNGVTDARSLTPDAYQALLQKLGIKDPKSGL